MASGGRPGAGSSTTSSRCSSACARDERDVVAALIRREFETARAQLVPFRRWLAARGQPGAPSYELLPEFERASLWEWTSAHFRINPGPGFSP